LVRERGGADATAAAPPAAAPDASAAVGEAGAVAPAPVPSAAGMGSTPLPSVAFCFDIFPYPACSATDTYLAGNGVNAQGRREKKEERERVYYLATSGTGGAQAIKPKDEE